MRSVYRRIPHTRAANELRKRRACGYLSSETVIGQGDGRLLEVREQLSVQVFGVRVWLGLWFWAWSVHSKAPSSSRRVAGSVARQMKSRSSTRRRMV